jgi:hypothetical protein
MATASRTQEQNETIQKDLPAGESVGSPVTNEAYNVITALQAKLEGLEAYRKYAKDPDGQVWAKLTQIELPAVSMLIDELERLVKDGKFRMQEPGRANH